MWVILLVIALGLLFYWKFVLPLYYWDNLKVPNKRGWPIFGKQLPVILKKQSMAEWFLESYNEFPNERFSGSHQFSLPVLVIRDPDLIRDLSIKMFDSFPNRISIITKEVDPLFGRSLINLHDSEWKSMRCTMSPAFTSSRMRTMFLLISECAEEFINYFKSKSASENTICIDSRDVFTRFGNDVISSCAFGFKTNSLVDKNNELFKMGQNTANFGPSFFLKINLFKIMPKVMKFFEISVISHKVKNFFIKLVREGIEYREKNNIVRPDMIHLLKEARKGNLRYEKSDVQDTGYATVEEHHIGKQEKLQKTNLSDEDITAQALFFYIAGFEPVSTLMCFMVHELALNSDIQERLRNEIFETHSKFGGFTYEAVLGMKYLDMVVSETLRKWPPAMIANRTASKSVTIPLKDGSNFELKEGTAAIIPILGIHRDPQYYPNPDKFDPERFNEENKRNILPYTYLPFGFGPRNCIGSRFALLEIKTLFVHLLSNFEVVAIAETPVHIKFSKKRVMMTPENGFWVGFKPLKK